jgi:CheY-like chemotaxis protein
MPETTDTHGLSILVVDDNEDAARSLGLLLSELGCSVRMAFDATTALLLAAQLRPELVLVDIVMPRMDGIELTESLRNIDGMADARIIGISGYDAERWKAQMEHAGLDGFISKPAKLEHLESLIRDVIGPVRSNAA